jgi:hypothetical protein
MSRLPFKNLTGAATGLLGVFIFFALLGQSGVINNTLIDVLLLVVLPGLFVALGSHLAVSGWKRFGSMLLGLSGSWLALMFFAHLFGGALYLFGLWIGLAILAQGVLAVLTMMSVFDAPKKM